MMHRYNQRLSQRSCPFSPGDRLLANGLEATVVNVLSRSLVIEFVPDVWTDVPQKRTVVGFEKCTRLPSSAVPAGNPA